MIENASLPSAALMRAQNQWLAPARSRLLRRNLIGQRHRVLDVGTGYCETSCELTRRAAGEVIALDRSLSALRHTETSPSGLMKIQALAENLPLRDGTFDLVFFQLALMWMDPGCSLAEAVRVLRPDGVILAIEPDYGGMIEYPPEIAVRDLWIKAIEKAGGDPCVGRKLPGILGNLGLHVRVDLLSELAVPSPERYDLLAGLPFDLDASERFCQAQAASHEHVRKGGIPVAHLPFFLITASRNPLPSI